LQIKKYFEQSKVTNFFAAANNEGRDKRPILLACAMQGPGCVDIHFKWARYRQSYIKEVFVSEETFLQQLKSS
jgi:hypothetical protein